MTPHRKATTPDERPLSEVVKAYGCPPLVALDVPLSDPAQIEYLDLLPKRGSGPKPETVNAVAEHQGTALLYLLDGRNAKHPPKLGAVQRQLANRSDPAWLGVVRLGSLEIYPIGFHVDDANELPLHTIHAGQTEAPLFFQSLVHGTFNDQKPPTGTDHVYRLIYDLLHHTTKEYVETRKLPPLAVLSMTGRALFFRFLIDRNIVLPEEKDDICKSGKELKGAFSTPKCAAETSAWLDETFNGDFLQLIDEKIPSDNREQREAAYLQFYRDIESQVGAEFFTHLQAILRGWRGVGGQFQDEFDWGDFNFAHIPVGVLSQVYEGFSHLADPLRAQQTSVHYTPRTIAKLMVDQCFANTPDAAAARVLDASCGAGVFLVLAFRRLVRERWQRDEKRPDTRAIQSLLYGQLRGFDISESALRLAALGLYITAIEVNGTQHPPKALKFPRNLRDEVLFHFGDKTAADASDKKQTFTLGSLGDNVPDHFNGWFDIVMGNPPWTRLRLDDPQNATDKDQATVKEDKAEIERMNLAFTQIGQRVLEERLLPELAKTYENPDNNPDLPFLWRATEWAKKDAFIALAMPARLFQRTSGKGADAWQAILRGVSVTGLINGADLRKTAVWKGVDMPWCLFFARNASSEANHRFAYATPSYDVEPNKAGRFRIDYEAAQPVGIADVAARPWLLKTLSLGTRLDVEVMDQIMAAFPQTLGRYWETWDPQGDKTGKGYDRSPELKQKTANLPRGSKEEAKPFLGSLKNFVPTEGEFVIDHDKLITYFESFKVQTAYWPKTKDLYCAPLVVVPKSPGEHEHAPKAYLSDQALAFSQIYYGYSCAGNPDAETLSSLIYLLAHSSLFRFFSLMVSTSQGADRMMFTKQDFDSLPFPDIAKLPAAKKKRLCALADQLQHDAKKPWQTIDEFLFQLYGLDKEAVQVAKDTLFAAASYRKAGREAFDRAMRSHREAFASELKEILEPFFDICGYGVQVREPADWQNNNWKQPWAFLAVSRADCMVPVHALLMQQAMEEANRHGASRIIIRAPGGRGVLIGLLNQRRWWTLTRARLCAQQIIARHLEACGLPEDA